MLFHFFFSVSLPTPTHPKEPGLDALDVAREVGD